MYVPLAHSYYLANGLDALTSNLVNRNFIVGFAALAFMFICVRVVRSADNLNRGERLTS